MKFISHHLPLTLLLPIAVLLGFLAQSLTAAEPTTWTLVAADTTLTQRRNRGQNPFNDE